MTGGRQAEAFLKPAVYQQRISNLTLGYCVDMHIKAR